MVVCMTSDIKELQRLLDKTEGQEGQRERRDAIKAEIARLKAEAEESE